MERAHRVAIATTRNPSDELIADPDGLRSQRDRARIVKGEATQQPIRLPRVHQSRTTDELALVEVDREPKPGFGRTVVRSDVAAPDPIALFESQRVDRLVSRSHEPVRHTCLPQGVPEPKPELRRRVELPAELADVRDARGEARDRTDREVLCTHVRKRVIRQACGREGLQHLPRLRPPDPKTGVLARHVGNVHRPVLVVRAARSTRDRGARTPSR